MRSLRVLAHRFHSLFHRSRAEADLESEITLHLEQLVKEYNAAGLTESEAVAAARRDFGPVALTKEHCRDMRRTTWLEDLARDIAFAFRVLRKSPVFTLTALLSLALGIGANTAIYSFIDAIMLRALPVSHPENLVVLNWRAEGGPEVWPKVIHSQHGDGEQGTFPYAAWQLLRGHNDVCSTLFAFAGAGRLNIVAGNQAFLGGGEFVSGNYFSSLGVPPVAGRLLHDDDDLAGAPRVAVVSYRFWQRAFNGSPQAIGQTILLNRNVFTVAGVTAPEFYGVNPRSSPEIYVPLHTLASLRPEARTRAWFDERNTYWIEMMGRLRPGITLSQAEIPLAGEFHRFVVSTAINDKERANLPVLWLEAGGSGIDSLRRQYSKPLLILITMTGLILAIACANLANLLLTRATARRREIAVRLSLGASRWRVVRQLLAESILISLLGGAMGLAVAAAGIRFLTWLLANGAEDFTLRATIDLRILFFATLVSIATGILFGLVPAIQATKVDVAPALKESRAVTARVRRFGLSHTLVAGQIAVSLLLVIAAGLFVRTLARLHSVAIGFNTGNLLLFSLNADQAGYDQLRGARLYETMRRRFEAIPGVRAATMSDMPLVADWNNSDSFTLPGSPVAPGQRPWTSEVLIGPSFFETMGIPILLGRPIGPQDTAGAPRSVVVNEVFAKKFFPGRSPVGRHLSFGEATPTDFQIVGVAKDSLYSSLKRAIPPVVYIPSSQPPQGWFIGGMFYELRTAGDPLAIANTVRRLVHDADPRLPVADLTTQTRRIDSTIAPERAFADLCTCFAVLALLIASVGLYGTMAYSVARRTNEIGIRMALGAERRRVLWMVLREVLALSLAGLAIGLGVALGTSRFVASFLFGVRASDPFSFGISAAILAACAIAAGYAPAWRASRIDPMQALRHE